MSDSSAFNSGPGQVEKAAGENFDIDYMIRVLSRQLKKHVDEYRAEGMEASPDSIIHGWSYDFTRGSLEGWIRVLEHHRHCTPAVSPDKGQG